MSSPSELPERLRHNIFPRVIRARREIDYQIAAGKGHRLRQNEARTKSAYISTSHFLYLQKIKREAVRRSPEVGHGLKPEL